MKKVFIIGGGVDASNYKDFEDYLLKEDFNPYEEKVFGWKDNLKEDLGEDFEVIKIPMPNKGFADYKYWKIMFEKALLYFGEENILVGHSLGGSFLLKFLEENDLENIFGIHLIAPAVFDTQDELLGSFKPSEKLENFKKYENMTNIYHSKDDELVPFSECLHLQKVLERSNFEVYEDKGHFIFIEHIEELVRNINK